MVAIKFIGAVPTGASVRSEETAKPLPHPRSGGVDLLLVKAIEETASEFSRQFNGRFIGALHWKDLDVLWSHVLAEPEGWHASLAGEAPPVGPLEAETLRRFVVALDALLRREHDKDYCGIVFADDREQPTFIKVYDPNNLGCFCGAQAGAHPPRWVLSRLRPDPIAYDAPLPNARKRWWQALFG